MSRFFSDYVSSCDPASLLILLFGSSAPFIMSLTSKSLTSVYALRRLTGCARLSSGSEPLMTMSSPNPAKSRAPKSTGGNNGFRGGSST